LIYVCVDCEASGPVPPLYNLLSIGATVVRPDGGRHALGRSFYVELQPIFPGFDPGAMAVCGLDAERLKREGRAPREAMTDLARFAREAARGETERPVFVGHNAVFDWSYIAYYTSKESLERLLGLPPQDPSRVHRADYDAEYQARILVALLDRMPREPARP